MKRTRKNYFRNAELPGYLKEIFWDVDFRALRWAQHRDFIIGRILALGTWGEVRWLRATVGDTMLREWLIEKQGARLDARTLRFWELILGLPRKSVSAWLAARASNPWDQRIPHEIP